MLLCLSRHVLVSPDWTEERPEQERKVGVVDGGWANYEAFLGLTLGVLSTTEFIYYYYYFFLEKTLYLVGASVVGYYPWSTQPYGVESKPRAGSLVIFKPRRKNDTTAKNLHLSLLHAATDAGDPWCFCCIDLETFRFSPLGSHWHPEHFYLLQSGNELMVHHLPELPP